MAAHFPLAPEPLASGVWVFAREVFGRSGFKFRVEAIAGAYWPQPDRRPGKIRRSPRTCRCPRTSVPGARRKRPNRRPGRRRGGPRPAGRGAVRCATARSVAGSSRSPLKAAASSILKRLLRAGQPIGTRASVYRRPWHRRAQLRSASLHRWGRPVRAEAIHWRHRERRNIRGIGKSQSVFGNYQSRRDGPIEAQGKAMRARRALPQPWVNDLKSSLATTWRS